MWRFDRLSRSLRDLLKVFDELEERGIQLRSLHEQLDTTSPMGKLMFHLAGMLAEFERNLIAERTKHGMAAAKQEGRRFGPAPKLKPAQVKTIVQRLRAGAKLAELAKKYHVSVVTLRDAVLKETGGKRLWRKGPRARR